MALRNQILGLVFFTCLVSTSALAREESSRGEVYEYDPGPDVSTPVGKKYAEIFAKVPNYREIGRRALGGHGEKFRWQFGPMFYRGRLSQNQVKVLIIGQEGAQDENISDRSFTGGTGGRMQNFLSYLGLDRSYLFINTFIYTIQGQYSDFDAPIFNKETESLDWYSQIPFPMLKLSQYVGSPIVDHRHELIDHVIASNQDSLRLVIAVGGAAQDTLATYIMAKGGSCQPSVRDSKKYQTIRYKSMGAGGNRRFYFPVDRYGNNLLLTAEERKTQVFGDSSYNKKLVGERIVLTDRRTAFQVEKELKKRAESREVLENLEKSTEGPYKTGIYDLRQLGSNLSSCVNSKGERNTLRGLNGIAGDVRFIQVRHPGSNSPTLQENFAKARDLVRSWQEGSSWKISPDQGMQAREDEFVYDALPVPRRDFRFGLPDIIGRGQTNSTRRNGGKAIEFGSRNAGSYDRTEDAYAPEKSYVREDLAWEPNKTNFQVFDSGPGSFWGRIFKGVSNSETKGFADLWDQVFKFNTITDPKFDNSAIYRGRPGSMEVLVLADQDSHDDMWVGRALMGLEGQKLQAFLKAIGVKTNYSILRLLPVDTLGGSRSEISNLVKLTRPWRESIWQELISSKNNSQSLKVILTMGEFSDREIENLPLPQVRWKEKGKDVDAKIPVVSLTRNFSKAYLEIAKIKKEIFPYRLSKKAPKFEPLPIAREDIPYGMRRWTGTAGDRVLRSEGEFSGKLYKIHAPEWATSLQPPKLTREEERKLKKLNLLTAFDNEDDVESQDDEGSSDDVEVDDK